MEYYKEISQKFFEHYFELAGKDIELVKPFYSDDAILEIDGNSIKSPEKIVEKLKNIGKITAVQPNKYAGQPYLDDVQLMILVATKINEKECAMAFILKQIDEKHRFAITHQVVDLN